MQSALLMVAAVWTGNPIGHALVALILAVSITLFRAAIVDVWTVLILLAGLLALLRFKIDSFWLVLAGAAAGLAHYLLTRL